MATQKVTPFPQRGHLVEQGLALVPVEGLVGGQGTFQPPDGQRTSLEVHVSQNLNAI